MCLYEQCGYVNRYMHLMMTGGLLILMVFSCSVGNPVPFPPFIFQQYDPYNYTNDYDLHTGEWYKSTQ